MDLRERLAAGAARLLLFPAAAAAAVAWALGMAVLQPLSEPTGPDAYGENNTYWAREIRWATLIGLILLLIVLARGSRWGVRLALAAGALWLAADLVLDRIGPGPDIGHLTAGAAAAAVTCCAVASCLPRAPRPETLFRAAIVAAVASGVVTATESPTDTEPALNVGSAAAGSLLALVAVIAAACAAEARTVSACAAETHIAEAHIAEARTAEARTAVARTDAAGVDPSADWFRIGPAVTAGAVASSIPWLVRMAAPQPSGLRGLAIIGFTVLLVVTVVALVAHRPGSSPSRHTEGVAAIITAVVLPVMFLPLAFAAVVAGIGEPFTILAGNPPIHDADEDVVLILMAVPLGLLLGWVLQSSLLTPVEEQEVAR